MESFSTMIFVCLALCIVPQVQSLECYMCGNPGRPCGPANKDSLTCNATAMEDRCATFVLNSVTSKNCFSSPACSPTSIGNPCVQMNMSAPACSLNCCQGDLCNVAPLSSSSSSPGPQPVTMHEGPTNSTRPISQQPTSGVPELTANFVAVITSVMLAKAL